MNSFPSSVFPLEANWEAKRHFLYCGRFHSVLVVFTNTKTFMEGETQYTRSTTKQDFPGEVLSKQNIWASLASLPCDSSQATTKRSAIFAFGVLPHQFVVVCHFAVSSFYCFVSSTRRGYNLTYITWSVTRFHANILSTPSLIQLQQNSWENN